MDHILLTVMVNISGIKVGVLYIMIYKPKLWHFFYFFLFQPNLLNRIVNELALPTLLLKHRL